MWETIKTIGVPILTFGLGFFSKRYIDNEKSTAEHDIIVFEHLDGIVNEDVIKSVYYDATSCYHIGQARKDLYVFLSEAPKTSFSYINENLEAKKKTFIVTTEKLLGYYAKEGLPTRNGDQSVDPATMERLANSHIERLRFRNEVMPKSDDLAEAFQKAFIDYRTSVKSKLKV